jgi:hypothetical protein
MKLTRFSAANLKNCKRFTFLNTTSHAYGEVLEPEARKFHDRTLATRYQDAAANVPVRAERMD